MAVFHNGLPEVHAVGKNDRTAVRRLLKKHSPSACIISAVAPVSQPLLRLLRSHMKVWRLTTRTRLPFKNGYRTPATLGNDRLACMAGARLLFPRFPVLVIDAGTCVKYDVIHRGVYRGGSISPGLQMRFDALQHFTAALPRLQAGRFAALPGRSTHESIRTGVQQGILFEMEGFIAVYKRQYKNLKVVLTGGDAARFAKPLKSDIFAAPHLIHLGLYEILKENMG